MNMQTRIDELIDRWEEMHEQGSPVTIEQLCADCPELAGEVQRRIDVLHAVDSALATQTDLPGSTAGERDRTGAGRPGGLPEVLRATAVYWPRQHHDQGGLGVIFKAYQEELDRLVALKRIRRDKLHETARRRFLREASLTARLQHPGIVPIYGLGHDEGGPFYTMPFIQGQTLQEAIDAFHGDDSLRHDAGRRSLQFRNLLQGFITACNTMDYAHAQGVVHRDLKPANIMLGLYGETLVMDWGLAKRFGGHDEASDDVAEVPSPSSSCDDITATGQVLGTPPYMSPERAKGEPASPASDIFSLGLVFYAILTGKSAFDESSFRGADRLKAVREAAIVPPRVRDARLPRALEAICLEAVAAKPDDRYASARALAEDVARWLADEPVTAWREPASMRARRWGRTHRTAVAAGVVALFAGVIGLGAVTAVQARANGLLRNAKEATARALEATQRAEAKTQEALTQSEESRRQAEDVSGFLVEAFRSPDPSQDGRQVKVVDLLDRASDGIDKELVRSQATRGALLDALGRTYLGLGIYDRALSVLTKARVAREAALGAQHLDTALSRSRLGNAYFFAGRLSEAIPLEEESYKRIATELGPDHSETLLCGSRLANAYTAAGQWPRAIPLQEEILKRRNAKLGPDHRDTLGTRNDLAVSYRAAGRAAQALALDEETLKLSEAKLGPDNPHTLMTRSNLGVDYRTVGRAYDALRLDEETLKRREVKLGSDHADTLNSRVNLAIDYWEAGRLSEAIELMESTLKRQELRLGHYHFDTLMSRNNLAAAYQESGRASEAIPLHTETLRRRETKLGPDHPHTLMSRINLALAYQKAGQPSEAIARFEAMLPRIESRLGPDHRWALDSRNGLAAAYESIGRLTRAEALYRDTLARRRKTAQPHSALLAADLTALAQNLLAQSRWPEAEPLLRESLAIQEKANPDDWSRYDAMSLLGWAILGQGRYAAAEPLVVDGYQGMKAREARVAAFERSRLREAALRVVRLYESWGRRGQADAWKSKLELRDLPVPIFAPP
jgi:tetratricopeptide (TPR) repeat protein/tRNA A-37 threonylcarbamoyl transferase component Bud32